MALRVRQLGWRLPVVVLAIMAVALASFAAGIAVRGAFAQPSSQTIYACKGDRSGSVRIVQQGEPCLRGESLMTWNVQGPPGPQGPAGPQGAPGEDGALSISGIVLGDGTLFSGQGFSVVRTDVGAYTVSFPPGTWSRALTPVVTPVGGGVTVAGLNISQSPDGSGEIDVLLTADSTFTFVAMQILE